MPNWLEPLVTTLLPGLIIAVVTATVTVRLSIKRFHAERWWERKAEAYTRIVESLYHVQKYCDAMVEDFAGDSCLSPEYKAKISEEYSAAYRELSKATAFGSLIICEEAAKLLDELRNRPGPDWDSNAPGDVFGNESEAYGNALIKVRRIAKVDLGVS